MKAIFAAIKGFFQPAKAQGSSDGESNKSEMTKEMNSQSEVIAKGNQIRDVNRLVDEYGGKASDWIKKKGTGCTGNRMALV